MRLIAEENANHIAQMRGLEAIKITEFVIILGTQQGIIAQLALKFFVESHRIR